MTLEKHIFQTEYQPDKSRERVPNHYIDLDHTY